jgi:hypothetical protein
MSGKLDVLFLTPLTNSRLLSLELGRKCMISHEDLEIEYKHSSNSNSVSLLNRAARLAICAASIEGITSKTEYVEILKLDADIIACDNSHDICQSGLLSLGHFHLSIQVQNCRLLLFRHLVMKMADRKKFLLKCYVVATNTVDLLSRVISPAGNSGRETVDLLSHVMSAAGSSKWNTADLLSHVRYAVASNRWDQVIHALATSYVCTHVWRCTLFLLSQGDSSAILLCAQISKAFGSTRPINNSCGRSLEYFLNLVVERIKRLRGKHLEHDNEMEEYILAVCQQDSSQGWNGHEQAGNNLHSATCQEDRPAVEDQEDWNSWEEIVSTLEELAETQQQMPRMDLPANIVGYSTTNIGSQRQPKHHLMSIDRLI